MADVRIPTVVETSSGAFVDLVNPDPNDIRIVDICNGLQNICRFTGQLRNYERWTVAQHCRFVAFMMLRDGLPQSTVLHGLLHDAHEAYFNDLSNPFKNIPGIRAIIKPLTDKMDIAIYTALELPFPSDEDNEIIRKYDLMALAIEADAFFISKGEDWNIPPVSDVHRDMFQKYFYYDYKSEKNTLEDMLVQSFYIAYKSLTGNYK